MAFELPQLGYDYSALEPHIDARTMEIHHTKHHAAYTDNLNKALQGSDQEGKSIEEVLKSVSKQSTAVRNNGGGYYNHNLYWKILAPGGASKPEGELLDALNNTFNSVENFRDAFIQAAMTRFGSGWAWLILQNDKLVISSTPNQDNPLMDVDPDGVFVFVTAPVVYSAQKGMGQGQRNWNNFGQAVAFCAVGDR